MSDFFPDSFEKEVVAIRLPADLLDQIDRLALRLQTTTSLLITECLRYALERLPLEAPQDQKE